MKIQAVMSIGLITVFVPQPSCYSKWALLNVMLPDSFYNRGPECRNHIDYQIMPCWLWCETMCACRLRVCPYENIVALCIITNLLLICSNILINCIICIILHLHILFYSH